MLYDTIEGRGIHGAVFPGCPETYQDQQQQQSHQSEGSRSQDQHQKVRQLREGDIVAVPTGSAHWIYNNGQSQLVLVALVDVGNSDNQLDQYLRVFLKKNILLIIDNFNIVIIHLMFLLLEILHWWQPTTRTPRLQSKPRQQIISGKPRRRQQQKIIRRQYLQRI